MGPTLRVVCSLLTLGGICLGCGTDDDAAESADIVCADRSELRNVYYGDLHVHTALSFDSYAFDVRNGPEDAYRFAKGAPLMLPPLDRFDHGTQSIQLDRPLDFAAVTEHAEFLGEVDICLSDGADGSDAGTCAQFRDNGPVGQTLLGVALVSSSPERDETVCGDGSRCLSAARSIWDRVVLAAESAQDDLPSCEFSALVGYEWTANTNASAQHRNVIFRGAKDVPFPTSYFEAPTVEGLWRALQRECREAGGECDVLTIPHNSNQSNGNTFFSAGENGAEAMRVEGAQLRAAMEPVVEIMQHKGESECGVGVSGILGDEDPFCNFEKLRAPPFEDCGDGTGAGGVAAGGCVSRLDFARGALLEGLREERRLGVNPLRLGFIGSTDTHNGTPGAVAESSFLGHRGAVDDELEDRLGRPTFRAGPTFNPGGLAAVWAEQNTRASIFDALQRREAFATSGPRIAVRFFGGWDFGDDLCDRADGVELADREGVPMGGVLPERAGSSAPTFLLSALRDVGGEQRPGTPLQQVQVIKGWIDEQGRAHQRVYSVLGDADNGAGVGDDCIPVGSGFDALCGVWSDPHFDPTMRAFYYARVLENPSCRWTGLQCALPGAAELESCRDPGLLRVIQERAWTSPIWYD